MNQPKVSVIIPVYNAEPYLRQCLDSVVNQTLKDIEIICVDDGSTDGSAELLRRLGESEPRLRLLQQENQGAGVARNRALAAARGEYIAFLDADDMLTPDALEAYYSTGIRTGADVLVAKGAVFSDDPRNAKERDFFLREEFIPLADTFSAKDCYPFVFSFTFGGQGGKCFRRSFIEENDLRFLTLPKSEDFYFIHRGIAKASCIAPIRRTLYLNRSVVTSLENQKDKMPLVFWEAVEMLKEKLKEDGLLEAVRQSFVNENVNRFAYNLRTMKTAEGFAAVLEKLRQVGETELGLTANPPRYYYLWNNYQYLCQLLGIDPSAYDPENANPEMLRHELQKKGNEINTLKDNLKKQQERADKCQAELESQKRRAVTLQYDLDCVRRSASFRVGRAVTWLPRKIRGGVRCLRDNGLGYTLRRLLYHMGLRKGEEEQTERKNV